MDTSEGKSGNTSQSSVPPKEQQEPNNTMLTRIRAASKKRISQLSSYVRTLWNALMGKTTRPLKERSLLILFLSFLTIIVLIALVAGTLVFVITLRGMETVVVPDVTGVHVVDAIGELQDRGITTYLISRYHNDPDLQDHVLDQTPSAGTVVRLGKQIQLMVSRGSIVDVTRDYVGRRLSDVQLELQQTFSAYDNLISVGNVSYVFSPEEPGVIIEQDPPPETPVSDTMAINFLVSRGAEPRKNIMDRYVGMDFATVLQRVSRLGMQFEFAISEEVSDIDGIVLGQSPAPDQALISGRVIRLEISPPSFTEEGMVFGLFPIDLDYYEAPVTIQVNAELPNQPPRVLIRTQYLGGPITIPFLESEGTVLVVYRDREPINQYVVVSPSAAQ